MIAELVSAIGCLDKVTHDKLPAAERRVLYPFVDERISASFGTGYVTKIAGLKASAAARVYPALAATEKLTSGLIGEVLCVQQDRAHQRRRLPAGARRADRGRRRR